MNILARLIYLNYTSRLLWLGVHQGYRDLVECRYAHGQQDYWSCPISLLSTLRSISSSYWLTVLNNTTPSLSEVPAKILLMVTDFTQSKATLIGTLPLGSGLCMSGPQSMTKRIWSRLSYEVYQRVEVSPMNCIRSIINKQLFHTRSSSETVGSSFKSNESGSWLEEDIVSWNKES